MSDDTSDNEVDVSEKALPPRRRDFSFYVVLVCAVIPLWSVIPLSWAFVLHTLWTGKVWILSWHGKGWFAAALCEVFFSIHQLQLARFVSTTPPKPPGNLLEIQAAFSRILQCGLASLPEDGFDEETLDDERPGSPAEHLTQLEPSDPRAIDFRNSLRAWFRWVPWSHIRKQEVYAWLYCSIFNAVLPEEEKLSKAHKAVLDDTVQKIEMRCGVKIPDGSNPSVRPLRLTLDLVNLSLRPFGWYFFVAVVNRLLRVWYTRQWGVTFGRYQGLEYMLHTPSTWSPTTGPSPVVFIHGLGLGLAQYNLFLSHLLQILPDRPVLVPIQPHVSQDVFHRRFLDPMGRHEMAGALEGLVRSLGWVGEDDASEGQLSGKILEVSGSKWMERKITVMSHSNGSYVHAWILKNNPNMIGRSCFVDPVTFCSWEGDTCYNFIYKPCSTGIELIMRYFVGSELGVANLLQRHFDWTSNSLWYEEIPNARDPNKTMFLLGGKDAIVDAERVKRYLTSHGIRKGLWFDPDGRHGQALLVGGDGHSEILRWLHDE
ncbi:hypothetical protein JAAARDRAFT_36545 [Jaapia argillacea MUCL 33604]|uniref:AB hydrolase-1 domain-containing protein n=1 Tax=Jaapia argillacea MUCL 33604 TaxID=933084 RepID=A0A067PNK0_9AGAM|nr:hypothetical protein JAAARDRAFT_36545 [Jaapia argillacea MUCL 33604]